MVPTQPFLGYTQVCRKQPVAFAPQHQDRVPAMEHLMQPRPIAENPAYRGSGKLQGRSILLTGGDSGIGRAAAYAFAKEGALLSIAYYDEHRDARETAQRVEELGGRCQLLAGDLRVKAHCEQVVRAALGRYGRLDVLVCNHGIHLPQPSILDISQEQLELTFQTNLFSYFYLIQAALPYLRRGASIICTVSVNAYAGHPTLIDYTASKGAVLGLIRSLSLSLKGQGIRVNGVAPGPVWTPLITSLSPREIATFGVDETSGVPMGRAGQPFELAPSYVFLACDDSSYLSGQVLHPNGGRVVNG